MLHELDGVPGKNTLIFGDVFRIWKRLYAKVRYMGLGRGHANYRLNFGTPLFPRFHGTAKANVANGRSGARSRDQI